MTDGPTVAPRDRRSVAATRRMMADGGEFPNGIVVEAVDDDASSEYEFSVEGALIQVDGVVDGREVSKNFSDNVSEGVASGNVAGGADGFRYEGSIEWFWADAPGDVDVYVNGERRSHDDLGASDDRAPTARIDLPARTVEVDTPVELRGDESTEATGAIVSYSWTVERIGGLDIRFGTGETTTVELPSTGPWRVRLTVEDDEGMTDQAVKRLTVEDDIRLEPMEN